MASKTPLTLSATSRPEVYFVDTGPVCYGPWRSKAVADLVARIINMDESEEAAVMALDLDPHATKLIAGLRPFKIVITRQGNHILEKQIVLSWPPEEESCKLREEEAVVEYFVWAKTQTEAYRIMASLSSQPAKNRPVFETETVLPLTEEESAE